MDVHVFFLALGDELLQLLSNGVDLSFIFSIFLICLRVHWIYCQKFRIEPDVGKKGVFFSDIKNMFFLDTSVMSVV